MKLAILWSRFGPYHVARVEGALAAGNGRRMDVYGIEVASTDATYEWNIAYSGTGGWKRTVFPGRSYDELGTEVIRRGLWELLDGADPDVIAVNGWSVPEAQAALSWRDQRPGKGAVLMTETKRDDRRRLWFREWIKKRVVARFDTALVGGRKQEEYLRSLGMPGERIFRGYDAVDNEYFSSSTVRIRERAGEKRRELSLPERYFLCCTRLLPRKNVDGLLVAYRRYLDAEPPRPWGLVILGSGEQEQRLHQKAASLDLHNVVWPGFVQYDTLPAYYGLASAFIHPARSEAWGLVVNEAAASGLPLLVSAAAGAGDELVEEGVNGFLFDPNDAEEIARKMAEMTSLCDAARMQMGENSRAIVARFSPRVFGEQLVRAADLAATLACR